MTTKINALSKRLLHNAGQNGPVVLMYHSICNGRYKPDSPWSVAFDTFKRQLDVIAENNWSTMTVSSYNSMDKPQNKTAVITFDDGYKDNYSAYKELLKRGMNATWYIVTDDIGRQSSWVGSGNKPMLEPEQLIDMTMTGMEIGSHSCAHMKLNTLCANDIRTELKESKLKLETILQYDIKSLAYPYGAYNDDVVVAARESGYSSAVSTRCGFGLVNNNPLLIRRVAIMAHDSPSSFARKLTFANNDVGPAMLTRYGLSRLKYKFINLKR